MLQGVAVRSSSQDSVGQRPGIAPETVSGTRSSSHRSEAESRDKPKVRARTGNRWLGAGTRDEAGIRHWAGTRQDPGTGLHADHSRQANSKV